MNAARLLPFFAAATRTCRAGRRSGSPRRAVLFVTEIRWTPSGSATERSAVIGRAPKTGAFPARWLRRPERTLQLFVTIRSQEPTVCAFSVPDCGCPWRGHRQSRLVRQVCGGIGCGSQGFPGQRARSCSRRRPPFSHAERVRTVASCSATTGGPPTPRARVTMRRPLPAGRRPVAAAAPAAATDPVATTGPRPTEAGVRRSAVAAVTRTATARSAQTTRHAVFKGRHASTAA